MNLCRVRPTHHELMAMAGTEARPTNLFMLYRPLKAHKELPYRWAEVRDGAQGAPYTHFPPPQTFCFFCGAAL